MVGLDKFNTYNDFKKYLNYVSTMTSFFHNYKSSCGKEVIDLFEKHEEEFNSNYDELLKINREILGQYLDNRKIIDIIFKSLNESNEGKNYDIRAYIESYNSCKSVIKLDQSTLYKSNFIDGNKGFVFIVNKNVTDIELINYIKNNKTFNYNEDIVLYDRFFDIDFDEYLDKKDLCNYVTLFLNIDIESLNNVNEMLFNEYKKSIGKEKTKAKVLENDK